MLELPLPEGRSGVSAVSAERCGRARAGAGEPGAAGDPGLERERTRSAERAASGRTQSEGSLASFRGSPRSPLPSLGRHLFSARFRDQ